MLRPQAARFALPDQPKRKCPAFCRRIQRHPPANVVRAAFAPGEVQQRRLAQLGLRNPVASLAPAAHVRLPSTCVFPFTSNFAAGAYVPIPILPFFKDITSFQTPGPAGVENVSLLADPSVGIKCSVDPCGIVAVVAYGRVAGPKNDLRLIRTSARRSAD